MWNLKLTTVETGRIPTLRQGLLSIHQPSTLLLSGRIYGNMLEIKRIGCLSPFYASFLGRRVSVDVMYGVIQRGAELYPKHITLLILQLLPWNLEPTNPLATIADFLFFNASQPKPRNAEALNYFDLAPFCAIAPNSPKPLGEAICWTQPSFVPIWGRAHQNHAFGLSIAPKMLRGRARDRQQESSLAIGACLNPMTWVGFKYSMYLRGAW